MHVYYATPRLILQGIPERGVDDLMRQKLSAIARKRTRFIRKNRSGKCGVNDQDFPRSGTESKLMHPAVASRLRREDLTSIFVVVQFDRDLQSRG
jgi:hypothetical protein